jgi:hypothetical protein
MWILNTAPHPPPVAVPHQAYMERVHAPLLMNPLVQAIVVALFVTGACGPASVQ